MNRIQRMEIWGDRHHPKIMDIVRISLGIFLMARGIALFNNTPYIRDLIIENKIIRSSPTLIEWLIYYVEYVHLVGGFMIFLGLFTRIGALVQLPVLIGAVFLVNILNPFVNAELWLSVLVLSLLVLFIVIGSGPWSVDEFWKKRAVE